MKKLIHIVFGIIIALTIVVPIIEITNIGADIHMDSIEKLVEALALLILAVVLLIAELGLYYNCIYFFTIKHKKVWKTLYNVLMLVISSSILLSVCGDIFLKGNIWGYIYFGLSATAFLLWFIYALLCTKEMLSSHRIEPW